MEGGVRPGGMEKKESKSRLMQKYEVGRLLGQGNFAKVYHGRNINSDENVAIKVINKEKVLKVGLTDHIKREISIMRLIRHPNVVQLYEVMASKTKIYFAMEYVKGGELFNKVSKGKLKEEAARRYFQQLIGAVDYCHSRGVYHRDLKPENLLLDENGNLKITDFGLSALWESRKQDGLLHTTCGTPAYVAPEVINKKGYDGAKADIWSCGVILFVLLAGYLPFHDFNLIEMYRKITKGDFKCPQWFPHDVRKLLYMILDPNPNTRITVEKIMENSWFKKGFKRFEAPNSPRPSDVSSLADSDDMSSSTSDILGNDDEQEGGELVNNNNTPRRLKGPANKPFNAFDLISLSKGFDLSGLFEDGEPQKPEARFTSTKPASTIVSKFEELGNDERFKVVQDDSTGVVKLQGSKQGRKGQLGVDAEIFEVTPSFSVVEVKKTSGDTLEYQHFCHHHLKPSLKDVVWVWQQQPQNT